jgi:hypothetical protein
VTAQHLIGELVTRLEQLQAATRDDAAREVADLRYQVETCPVSRLSAELARALAVAERACWESLDRGDAAAFARQAAAGADLRLFGECARLTVADSPP